MAEWRSPLLGNPSNPTLVVVSKSSSGCDTLGVVSKLRRGQTAWRLEQQVVLVSLA